MWSNHHKRPVSCRIDTESVFYVKYRLLRHWSTETLDFTGEIKVGYCVDLIWGYVQARYLKKKTFLKGRMKDDRSHDELRRRWVRGERLVIEVFGWWMTLNGWKHLSFFSVRLPLDQGFHQVKTFTLICISNADWPFIPLPNNVLWHHSSPASYCFVADDSLCNLPSCLSSTLILLLLILIRALMSCPSQSSLIYIIHYWVLPVLTLIFK